MICVKVQHSAFQCNRICAKAQHLFHSFGCCVLLSLLALWFKTAGASADMSFAWTLCDRIIDLSHVFANHFNNLLALDFQEETVREASQDANKGNGGRFAALNG